MSGIEQLKGLAGAQVALEAVDRKHGENPRLYDVRRKSGVTDYYLVVTGNSGPQIKALANELHVAMKSAGGGFGRKSGEPESGWVALDYGDLVIHIFSPESRRYYAIEDLWGPSTLVDPDHPKKQRR